MVDAVLDALRKGDGLPQALYRAREVRDLDARTMAEAGVSGFELMQRAGRSAFRHAARKWPDAGNWLVLCGGGKNGGDGYIIAGQATQQGKNVRCLALSDPAKLKAEAREAYKWALGNQVNVETIDMAELPAALTTADLVVDAMLGTGLTGAVRAPYADAISALNDSGRPVLAVDMPSGLCSDTGRLLGSAVRADLTVTFIGLKLGLMTGHGADAAGTIVFDSLGSDSAIQAEVPATALRLDWRHASAGWPRRRPAAHKGDFGRVLVVGGDLGMGGAALLAAESAARIGAGMVFVATRGEHIPAFLARRPELIVRPVAHRNELLPMLEKMDAVIIGPGLGTSAWGEQMLQVVRNHYDGPVLADADALNLLAAEPGPLPASWVLTPHPGEAARLLGSRVSEVEADRIAAVDKLCQDFRCTVLLKGAGTLVQGPPAVSEGADAAELRTVPTLIHAGNPGMASGGMGDVLSGFIGALLANGLAGFHAACLGATLHGASADVAAAELSMASLLAADLPMAAARLLLDAESALQSRGVSA